MATPAPPRRILLVDADAFFVAVARQQDPEGAGRAPLLIVGGRPGSRGVVCSASYECRAYGVRSAMPISRALRLCPQAMCVPVPRHACGHRSKDIHAVLSTFAPVVQASSIDEWYCDMAGTEALYGDEPLAATAHRIRSAVYTATGLHVSIGAGTSRLVAKMAVEVAKPKPGTSADGVHHVAPSTEVAFLGAFKLADLPMVGPRFAARLERFGLVRIADAQAWTKDTLVERLGARSGAWLFHRVRGIDDTVVVARDGQKQVSREETFARDLHDDDLIERELLRLAVRVATDLRNRSLKARTVTVKLKDTDFRTRSAQHTLQRPIESEQSVARAARVLLRQLRGRRRVGVRLLGIGLSHFDEGRGTSPQTQLFEAPPIDASPGEPVEGDRDRALTRAVDRIRARFGSAAILPARLIVPASEIGPRVEE